MVLFRVRIRLDHAQRVQVMRSLMQAVWQAQSSPGCISALLCLDATEEDDLVLIEEWRTKDHLVARLRADSMRMVLAAIDCSIVPPEVRFDTLSETKGLAFIAECRSGWEGI